jgi:hypothetical protein
MASTTEVERSGLVLEAAVGDVAGEEYEEEAPEFAVIARRPADAP